jgi:hypothetical protein
MLDPADPAGKIPAEAQRRAAWCTAARRRAACRPFPPPQVPHFSTVIVVGARHAS